MSSVIRGEATASHDLARFACPLTDDQLELRESVAAFANARLTPGVAERDRSREFPKELIDEMARMGLMGVKVPIGDGGAGGDHVVYALLIEAIARADGGWRITGQKVWVTSGAHAGLYLLFARTGEGGIGCFVVEPGTQGLEIGRDEQKMGQRSSGTVALHLDGCFVPDSHLIGDPQNGFRMALRSLTGGRVGIAALAIGLAEAALEEGMRYVHERVAFGKRIVEFQNTQFVLAESRTELDAAWLFTLRAAFLLDRGLRALQEASMAKYWVTEATGRVIDRMLQLHGGYGYSEEYASERIYRDHRVTRIYEGTNEIQRLVIAHELVGSAG